MGGPVKPEGETGGVGGMSRVASRIHQLEERGLTQFKRMIKNLLAGSVLCVADAAHVQLFPLIHEAALQPVQPPLSPPAPPSPLHSTPHNLKQSEASEYAAVIHYVQEGGGEIIHLCRRSLGASSFKT